MKHQGFYEIGKRDVSFYLKNSNMVKVVRYLSCGGASLGQIARAIDADWTTAKKIVDKLQTGGIVLVSKFGKRGYWITLNQQNPVTRQLLRILKEWYG